MLDLLFIKSLLSNDSSHKNSGKVEFTAEKVFFMKGLIGLVLKITPFI